MSHPLPSHATTTPQQSTFVSQMPFALETANFNGVVVEFAGSFFLLTNGLYLEIDDYDCSNYEAAHFILRSNV